MLRYTVTKASNYCHILHILMYALLLFDGNCDKNLGDMILSRTAEGTSHGLLE